MSNEISAERDPKLIALNLKTLLLRSGMSQADVSRATDIPRDAFGRYLHGVNLPKAGTVAKIAEAFGCSPREIDPSLPESIADPVRSRTSSPLFAIGHGSRKGHLRIRMDTELPTDVIFSITKLMAEYSKQAPEDPSSLDVLEAGARTETLDTSDFEIEP